MEQSIAIGWRVTEIEEQTSEPREPGSRSVTLRL